MAQTETEFSSPIPYGLQWVVHLYPPGKDYAIQTHPFQTREDALEWIKWKKAGGVEE